MMVADVCTMNNGISRLNNNMSPMLASNVLESFNVYITGWCCCRCRCLSLASILPSINELCVLFWFRFQNERVFSRLVSENRLTCWIEISAYLVSIRTNTHTHTHAGKYTHICYIFIYFTFHIKVEGEKKISYWQIVLNWIWAFVFVLIL